MFDKYGEVINDFDKDAAIRSAEAGLDRERVILEAHDLVKQYEQSDEIISAVNRVDLKVREGEFVAIVGPSGSGKSTLLHLLAGLDRPNAGSIVIRGQDITQLDEDELGRFRGEFLGMVFQSHNLIPQFTALENILIPTMMCRKADQHYEETLKKLVSALGIADRLHHLPSELSGGQQQRVAIARAMINMPHILFADEPTGNLDRQNADEVLDLLLETKAMVGQTLVMVTHDMSIANRADRIFHMDDGRLTVEKKR
ncbi:MAG: ABC transporter ATP-binding protein [Clostridia bacterium]|nr:ABC transporter ATP-binding protein [Clostridia bacterium]